MERKEDNDQEEYQKCSWKLNDSSSSEEDSNQGQPYNSNVSRIEDFARIQTKEDLLYCLANSSLVMVMDLMDIRVHHFPIEVYDNNNHLSSEYNDALSEQYVLVYCPEFSLIVFVLKGLIQSECNHSVLALAYKVYNNGKTMDKSLDGNGRVKMKMNTDFYEIMDRDTSNQITIYQVKQNTVLFDKMGEYFMKNNVNIIDGTNRLWASNRKQFREIFVEVDEYSEMGL
jgi:hypothetical protein